MQHNAPGQGSNLDLHAIQRWVQNMRSSHPPIYIHCKYCSIENNLLMKNTLYLGWQGLLYIFFDSSYKERFQLFMKSWKSFIFFLLRGMHPLKLIPGIKPVSHQMMKKKTDQLLNQILNRSLKSLKSWVFLLLCLHSRNKTEWTGFLA